MYYETDNGEKTFCKKCQQRFKKGFKLNKNKVPDDCIPPKNYKKIIDNNRVDKFVNIKDIDENDENVSQNSDGGMEDDVNSAKDRRKQMTIVKKIDNNLEKEKI